MQRITAENFIVDINFADRVAAPICGGSGWYRLWLFGEMESSKIRMYRVCASLAGNIVLYAVRQ